MYAPLKGKAPLPGSERSQVILRGHLTHVSHVWKACAASTAALLLRSTPMAARAASSSRTIKSERTAQHSIVRLKCLRLTLQHLFYVLNSAYLVALNRSAESIERLLC